MLAKVTIAGIVKTPPVFGDNKKRELRFTVETVRGTIDPEQTRYEVIVRNNTWYKVAKDYLVAGDYIYIDAVLVPVAQEALGLEPGQGTYEIVVGDACRLTMLGRAAVG